jgi:hypothetical protein
MSKKEKNGRKKEKGKFWVNGNVFPKMGRKKQKKGADNPQPKCSSTSQFWRKGIMNH